MKVSEMEAEYFPPKEDVVLQNEAPTDLYILVSGSVEMLTNINGNEKPFTVRTAELSQILRLSNTSLINIFEANKEDGQTVMSNLFLKLKAQGSDEYGDTNTGNICSNLFGREKGDDLKAPRNKVEFKSMEKIESWNSRYSAIAEEDHTKLHSATYEGNSDIVKIQLENSDANLEVASGWEQKASLLQETKKDIHELYTRKTPDDQKLKADEEETSIPTLSAQKTHKTEDATRITIHNKHFQNGSEERSKLILLPDTIEELLRIAGKIPYHQVSYGHT
ncbi:Potassium channel KAT1-like protein [Drosera capensis]